MDSAVLMIAVQGFRELRLQMAKISYNSFKSTKKQISENVHNLELFPVVLCDSILCVTYIDPWDNP